MFSSFLQFLFASRSEIVMMNAVEWCDILDNLSKKVMKAILTQVLEIDSASL